MKKALLLAAALAACSRAVPDPLAADDATADEVVRAYVARGAAAIPELKARIDDPNPVVRKRVKDALGRITGQWGSTGRLVWKRALAEATGQGKPILLLHLFGKFDEVFC